MNAAELTRADDAIRTVRATYEAGVKRAEDLAESWWDLSDEREIVASAVRGLRSQVDLWATQRRADLAAGRMTLEAFLRGGSSILERLAEDLADSVSADAWAAVSYVATRTAEDVTDLAEHAADVAVGAVKWGVPIVVLGVTVLGGALAWGLVRFARSEAGRELFTAVVRRAVP